MVRHRQGGTLEYNPVRGSGKRKGKLGEMRGGWKRGRQRKGKKKRGKNYLHDDPSDDPIWGVDSMEGQERGTTRSRDVPGWIVESGSGSVSNGVNGISRESRGRRESTLGRHQFSSSSPFTILFVGAAFGMASRGRSPRWT